MSEVLDISYSFNNNIETVHYGGFFGFRELFPNIAPGDYYVSTGCTLKITINIKGEINIEEIVKKINNDKGKITRIRLQYRDYKEHNYVCFFESDTIKLPAELIIIRSD